MYSIIFLDIDGVLNSVDWYDRRGERPEGRSHLEHSVDPAALARLNRLCTATGAAVVLSSTWRHGWAIKAMQADFRHLGATFRVIGKTPNLPGTTRGVEIATWLENHGPVGRLVILDDDAHMGDLQDDLVRTDRATGLTDEDVDRAVALLTSEAPDVAR